MLCNMRHVYVLYKQLHHHRLFSDRASPRGGKNRPRGILGSLSDKSPVTEENPLRVIMRAYCPRKIASQAFPIFPSRPSMREMPHTYRTRVRTHWKNETIDRPYKSYNPKLKLLKVTYKVTLPQYREVKNGWYVVG